MKDLSKTLWRVCKGCEESKHPRAYVGIRPYCRSCWYYINKDTRKKYQVYQGKGREVKDVN